MNQEHFANFVDQVAQKLARYASDKSAFLWTCEKMRNSDEFESGEVSGERLLRLLLPTMPRNRWGVFTVHLYFLAGCAGLRG